MNLAEILAIVEEIAQAGPAAVKLVKDTVTTINDLRTGKSTQSDFANDLADIEAIAGEALGLKAA